MSTASLSSSSLSSLPANNASSVLSSSSSQLSSQAAYVTATVSSIATTTQLQSNLTQDSSKTASVTGQILAKATGGAAAGGGIGSFFGPIGSLAGAATGFTFGAASGVYSAVFGKQENKAEYKAGQTVSPTAAAQMQSERKQQWEKAYSKIKEKRECYRRLKEESFRLEQLLANPSASEEELNKIKEELRKIQEELVKADQALFEAKEDSKQLRSQLEGYKDKLAKLEEEKKGLLDRLTQISHFEEHLQNEMWIPLFAAVDNEDTDLISTILNQGYDINSLASGITVLHRAIETGSEEVIKLLLKNKADPNKKSNTYETPFHRAILKTRHLDISIIQLLIKEGAKVTIPMNNATMSLHFIKETILAIEVEYRAEEKKEVGAFSLNEHNLKLKEINQNLQKHKQIETMLIEANKKQDIEKVLDKINKSIKKKVAKLEIKYRTPINLLSNDPGKLENSLNIFSIYLGVMKIDRDEIIEILDSYKDFSSHPPVKNERERLIKEIDSFFSFWKQRLSEADAESRKLQSPINHPI